MATIPGLYKVNYLSRFCTNSISWSMLSIPWELLEYISNLKNWTRVILEMCVYQNLCGRYITKMHFFLSFCPGSVICQKQLSNYFHGCKANTSTDKSAFEDITISCFNVWYGLLKPLNTHHLGGSALFIVLK